MAGSERFEQSKSEAYSANRPSMSRKEISDYRIDSIQRQRANELKAKRKQIIQGNQKYTDEGIIFRMLGIQLVDYKSLTGEDLASFKYGYFQISNILLLVLAQNNIPDRLNNIIAKKKIELDYTLRPYELLYQIGSQDSSSPYINIGNLPKNIQSNIHYMQGYESNKVLKKKGR